MHRPRWADCPLGYHYEDDPPVVTDGSTIYEECEDVSGIYGGVVSMVIDIDAATPMTSAAGTYLM
jgi:hypothetical protein